MDCPECQTYNPGAHKFCRECGTKLISLCPKCGYQNLPDAKYCGECGNALIKASEPPPDKYASPQSYTPKHLADKILTDRKAIEGERKTVTILFADVAGSTAMFEKLDPEAVHDIMDGCFRIILEQIHRYEGTVNQFRGDGVMALFGAPIAHEDHAQRACHAALAIQKTLTPFRKKLESRYGIDFTMRIGINTGPVVVGAIGDDLRMDYTAQGDTANLAARMETLAEPGSVYVSGNTFALTEGFFRFEHLGSHKVKGKTEPVAVYRPIVVSSRRTRFDVNAERGLTPLVGRERDLGLILNAFRIAMKRRGQAVVISSEAGMGKSRLLYEFRKAIANEDALFLEGKCLSYSRSDTYHPIVEVLKAFFRIDGNSADAEIREKVATGLAALRINSANMLPYLLELLAVKGSGIDRNMGPEARRERINSALIRLVIQGARLRPLVIAIEDLHWIDTGSLDAIGEMLESIPAEPVLLVFTCRPQFTPDWGVRSYLHQITLSRLGEADSLSIASHMLETGSVVDEIARLVCEKTDGVPFFIEEFVRSLKDLNLIEDQGEETGRSDQGPLRIPGTIQDIIMSRVDVLPETARHIVKAGSVIEREFSHGLIHQVTGLDAGELSTGLSTLKDAELIYQRGAGSDTTYIFKHALTMEVVYASLLTSKKQRLHRQVARATEKLHGEDSEEYSASLARHFTKGELFEEAARYAMAAAKRAMRTGAYIDAIAHAKRQVQALEQLPNNPANQKQIIDARTILASYFMGLNRHLDARDAVAPIADLAVEMDYRKRLPGIYVALGCYYWVKDDAGRASEYLQKAVDISQKTGNVFDLWSSHYYLGTALSTECRFKKAIECFNVSLKMSEMGNHQRGICAVKGTMGTFVLYFSGKIDAAYDCSIEAVEAAEKCGDAHAKGLAYSSHGQVCICKGDFERAHHILMNAIDLCRKAGHMTWLAWAELGIGHTHFYNHRYKEAVTFYGQSFSTWDETDQLHQLQPYQKITLERALLADSGALSPGFDLKSCRLKNTLKVTEGAIDAITADILIQLDPGYIPEAEILVQAAIAADERNQTQWFLGQDYLVYAKLCRKKGDMPAARIKMSRAIGIFEECGADGWVRILEKQMA